MDGVRIELKGDDIVFDALESAIRRLADQRDMWAAIGRAMVDSTRRRFDAGAGPGGAPWSPSFRARSGKGKTLVGLGMRGGLMGSITYEADADGVRWGSNMIHARIHQMGGVIRPKNAPALVFRMGKETIFADSVTIPARPYLGLDDQDLETIEEIAAEALSAAVKGIDHGG